VTEQSTVKATGIMQGFPPPPAQRITLETWDRFPQNRWAFQNVRSVLPTRAIAAGTALPLPRHHEALGELPVESTEGQSLPLAALLEAQEADACLVIHKGAIVWERYWNGMNERSLHLSQSVSKSFTGAVAGILAGQGLLDLDRPLQDYVPELDACGYRDATLRQVLDMRSGIKFGEDYTDPDCEVGMLDRAAGWKPRRAGDPEGIYDLILRLEQERAHGGYFAYRSIETEVLNWVLERVSGSSLAELFARHLWQPMGAEAEACFAVDPCGTCLADGGLNAALRDYGRFGLLHAQGGTIGGRQVVPSEWVAASQTGDVAAFQEKKNVALADMPNACYSRQWWVLDRERGIQAAMGIFGQLIYVDPGRQVVMVVLATWSSALDLERRLAQFRAADAVGKALG